jgi:cation diffusion facilitator family transporter
MGSRIVVYGAITANLGIATSKLAAALITSSSAMLSEAIHSFVDTGNGVLLLVGQKRSERPPDADHPFGHGKELYFWSLIVAVLVFGVGGGVSVFEGVHHLVRPSELGDPTWNYIVLGVAFLFDGTSFAIGVKELWQQKSPRHNAFEALRESKDLSVVSVVLEDSAALIGLAFAFAGVFLAHRFEDPRFDGAASIAIGALLAVVASLLLLACRKLLIGERADPELVAQIRALALADEDVLDVRRLLTMQLGAQQILLNASLRFRPEMAGSEVSAAIDRLSDRIQKAYPEVQPIFIQPST